MLESELFSDLAHEFAERYRRGERPAPSEYAERYPELAEDIRELFPSLVLIERLGNGVARPPLSDSCRVRRDEPIPVQLGDYRILREIGRGGMGIVYEAVQESLGRHVALKVLPPSRHLSPIQLMRFQREARAAALLHHTNIVPVFGVGEHAGVHYFAMQYIEGQSLDAVIHDAVRLRRDSQRARTTAVDDATKNSSGNGLAFFSSSKSTTDGQCFRAIARIGAQAAEALAYAHSHGVVHRDIKPANLLLDVEGTLWVTDFGLAKADGSGELTSPGDVVGTLRYMAPERFSGKTDASSDVYSLGLTMYEMVTLTPAFAVSHRAQLINSILTQEPAAPRKHDPRIPADLETIVQRAIAKNPADRFPTADLMAKELGRFIEGRPILSRRLSIPRRIWRWSRRNQAVALLMLLAACLTAMLVVGSTAAAWKFREQRDAVLAEQDKTSQNLDKALAAQRQYRVELGKSLLLQARDTRLSGDPGRRHEGLKTLSRAAALARDIDAPPDHLAALADELIATLALETGGPVETWSELEYVPNQTAFAPEADRYVFLDRDHMIHVRRLSDRSEIKAMGGNSPIEREWPALARGGRFLIVWSGRSRLELWDLDRGLVPSAWPSDVRGAQMRGDGKQVAALRSGGELIVYDLPALNEVSRRRYQADASGQPSSLIALSQDGRYLTLWYRAGKIAVVYETASGRAVRELKFPSVRVWPELALSRDGGLVALVHDRAISVYDVGDGEELSLLQGHQSEGISVQFQPNGGLLASGGWDGRVKVWDPIRGRLLANLPGAFLGWTANGSSLIIGRDRELLLYEIAPAAERRTIDYRTMSDRPAQALYGPARVTFSPDGQLIAMAARPGGVCIVRASDGVALANLSIGSCDEALFLPDGALLTSNDRGLCRWPVQRKGGGTLGLGPPELLFWVRGSTSRALTGMDATADGRLVGAASPDYPGALLINPDRPWRRNWLVPHGDVADMALSPDGRWAATTGWGLSPASRELIVWEVATPKPVMRLTVGNARVAFSPAGLWLGVGGENRYRFFRTGSWAAGPQFELVGAGGRMRLAFHPSGRIAAIIDVAPATVRLVDLDKGSIVATLEAPNQSDAYGLVFSPDGRYLAVPRSDQRIDLWDLSLVRRRLAHLDLATGLADVFDGGPTRPPAPAVERIEVLGADAVELNLLSVRYILRATWRDLCTLVDPTLDDAAELWVRADRWDRLGQWQLAAADYRASLARRPDFSLTANEFAWRLITKPDRGAAGEAVYWARAAVKLEPDNAAFRNTLGLALYREGEFAEAARVLESNAHRNLASAGFDWLFLAMCQEKLGQSALARTALENALWWRAQQVRMSAEQATEFQRFLRETESVLNDGPRDLPAEVFAPWQHGMGPG
jgi:eukaryotic-like serine/threonine-protein kinase